MEYLPTPSEGLHLLRGSSERCSAPKSQINTLPTSSNKTYLKDVAQMSLSWHNLVVSNVKTGDQILKGVSGAAESGEFIALMGASGAGKTTLLNTLQYRNLHNLEVTGEVLVEGQSLGTGISNVSGYVQQDALFLSSLTVKEHLMIQARLRLTDMNNKEMCQRVDEVILQLGLTSCQDTTIGISSDEARISIGESHRLCFASELLDNPSLLFCDEPTTGMDSSMADSVINIMASLCRDGRTIICTIHQPSSHIFRKFDKVMLLAAGQVAYFGPPMQAVSFFRKAGFDCPTNYNPADFVIETLAVQPHNEDECRVRIKKICEDFENSEEGQECLRFTEECRKKVGKYPDMRRRAGFFTQVRALSYRSLLDNWRNKALTRAKLIQKSTMAIFVGLLFWQSSSHMDFNGLLNINGAMFYIIVELTYPTLFGILTFLPKEFQLLKREYHDGLYDVSSYFIARMISYFPIFSLDGLLLMTIAYWMVGLAPSAGNFFLALAISLLIEQSAASFGIMLSSVCPSYAVAISISGPMLTCLTLTGGLYANVGVIPGYVNWVQYLSWFRYGFESYTINQWQGAALANGVVQLEGSDSMQVQEILSLYSFLPENMGRNLGAMGGMIVLFYLLGYLGLFLRVRLSR